MRPNDYVLLAMRTQCDQVKAFNKIDDNEKVAVPSLHTILGLTGELGELAAAYERWLWYQKEFDKVNVAEEIGDMMWYIAVLCHTLGLSLEDIMERNIAKLRVRFPEKFSEALVGEEARNRPKEREVLEQTGAGWAEPALECIDSLDPNEDSLEYPGYKLGMPTIPGDYEWFMSQSPEVKYVLKGYTGETGVWKTSVYYHRLN